MCRLVNIKNNKGNTVRVAEIKADTIKKIMEYASLCDKIDYLFIFGSAVDERCTEQSDIDIAVVSNVTRSKLFKTSSYDRFTTNVYGISSEQDYDFLQFNSMKDINEGKDFVCRDIKQKGVLIYERETV